MEKHRQPVIPMHALAPAAFILSHAISIPFIEPLITIARDNYNLQATTTSWVSAYTAAQISSTFSSANAGHCHSKTGFNPRYGVQCWH